MSKKKILFCIYCPSIIIAIILFLIFYPKNDNVDYAESLFLNISRELTISVGTSYTLPDNFITVKPSSFLATTSYTVTNKNGELVDGLTLENNIITSNIVGYYYIHFSVQGAHNELTDTLVVHVTEETTSNVKIAVVQKLTNLTVNEVKTRDELFEITCPDNANITINVSNEKIYYYEPTQKFLPKTEGEVTIELTIVYKTQIYTKSFVFIIEDAETIPNDEEVSNGENTQPSTSDNENNSKEETIDIPPIEENESTTPETNISAYSIMLIDTDVINFTFKENKIYRIQYLITYNNQRDISQSIECEISNNEILTLKSYDSPLISFTCKSQGSVQLTITYLADVSVKKIITINLI